MKALVRPSANLLLFTFALQIASPLLSAPAFASGSAASAPIATNCAPSLVLNEKEQAIFQQFNARLSWLVDHYGRPSFEPKLKAIVDGGWPRTKLLQVSPAFYERLQNLVDQARLKDLIARTIGFDGKEWSDFENQMRSITLHTSEGNDLMRPLDKVTLKLLKALGDVSIKGKKEEADALRAETVLRVSSMHAYLQRWRVLNGEINDERAQAMSQTIASTAIALVGAGILVSTFVVSGPLVGAAGATAATYAAAHTSSVVITNLAVIAAETAAGASIGIYGAPGARLLGDAYHFTSEAYKQSANKRSNLACELAAQQERWKEVAGDNLLSASLTGAKMGALGGGLTFTNITSKVMISLTLGGVVTAQGYVGVKLAQAWYASAAHYQLAKEAEDRGEHERAIAELKEARELAQEAGEHGLESIVIATLSYHMGSHFKHALHEGSSAIRKLYASAADTVPTAYSSAEKTARAGAAMVIK